MNQSQQIILALLERAVSSTASTVGGKTKPIDAMLDPSVGELLALISQNDGVRALPGSKHFLAFAAEQGLHFQVADAFRDTDRGWDDHASLYLGMVDLKHAIRRIPGLAEVIMAHPLRRPKDKILLMDVLAGMIPNIVANRVMEKMFTKARYPFLLEDGSRRRAFITETWEQIDL
jgi:hypothetical protein